MNANRIAHLYDEPELPTKFDGFSDGECVEIRADYHMNPADVSCPLCGPGRMRVLLFIDPEKYDGKSAVPVDPVGKYTPVLYCRCCTRAVGLICYDAPEEAR